MSLLLAFGEGAHCRHGRIHWPGRGMKLSKVCCGCSIRVHNPLALSSSRISARGGRIGDVAGAQARRGGRAHCRLCWAGWRPSQWTAKPVRRPRRGRPAQCGRHAMVGDPVANERFGRADLQLIAVAGFQAQRPDPGLEYRTLPIRAAAGREPRHSTPPASRADLAFPSDVPSFYPRNMALNAPCFSWTDATFAPACCLCGASAFSFSSHEFFPLRLFPGKALGLPAFVLSTMAFGI